MLHYITEGARIFLNSCKSRIHPKKYPGNAEEICHAIVKDCWNGRFFQTSTGNFPQFWTRDFGWCTFSLMKLGEQKEIHQTLRYALNRFSENGRITTTLTPRGKPFDFPVFAVDSLPWLIHSIAVSKFPYYSYRHFLNREIQRFVKTAIDSSIDSGNTGLVKQMHFSSMKDLAVRSSSCYDNCMAALLAKDLTGMKELQHQNPLKNYNYPALIKQHFWNGNYFYDDLTQKQYVAGDANLFPFALGIIKDEEMLRIALKSIRDTGLDAPFPLKYSSERGVASFIFQEVFLRNYEGNAIWTHMGPLYIKLTKQVDPELAKQYTEKYTQLIEKHGNYLEVFSPKGKPYSSPFYYCDRGMLWACNYLTL